MNSANPKSLNTKKLYIDWSTLTSGPSSIDFEALPRDPSFVDWISTQLK